MISSDLDIRELFDDLRPSSTVVETVNWQKAFGNRYLQRLDRDMLKPEGLTLRKAVRIKGTPTMDSPRACDITYDVDYVKNKLVKTVLEPLKMSKEEFIKLLDEIL